MDIKRFLGRYWLIKLSGTNILCYRFYFPYLYCFYTKNKNASISRQLFFQARREHGAVWVLIITAGQIYEAEQH